MFFKKNNSTPEPQEPEAKFLYIYFRGKKELTSDFFDRGYGVDRFDTLCRNLTIGEYYNLNSCVFDFLEAHMNETDGLVYISKFVRLNFSSIYDFLTQSSRHALEAADRHPGIDHYNRQRLTELSSVIYSHLKTMMILGSNKEKHVLLQSAYNKLTQHHEKYGFRTGAVWESIYASGDNWEYYFVSESVALSKKE